MPTTPPTEHRYEARVTWTRDGARFTDNRYSRRHEWVFDGGVTIPASASPSIVPPPRSDPAAVDPEEALVAAASSCHMLWFLSFAAQRGFVVDSYEDRAHGFLAEDAAGRLAFVRLVLRPNVRFASERGPTAEELAGLHESAHDACFIARSLRCPVRVESP